jgi:hypothetical protein
MEERLIKIFNHYGFHSQKEKFKEKVLKCGAALQIYINEPSEGHLKELKEKICDLLVVEKQFSLTDNRDKLFKKIEGFYHNIVTHYGDLIKSTFRENRKEIEIIMNRKIEITLIKIATDKGRCSE